MEHRVCRRCLLKELDGAYFQSVYEYIKSIPEEEKTDPAEYAGRLEQCRRCDSLRNGMCALCGCFVEVRAAKKRQHCAQSEKIW